MAGKSGRVISAQQQFSIKRSLMKWEAFLPVSYTHLFEHFAQTKGVGNEKEINQFTNEHGDDSYSINRMREHTGYSLSLIHI